MNGATHHLLLYAVMTCTRVPLFQPSSIWRRSKICSTLFCTSSHSSVISFHWLAFQNKLLLCNFPSFHFLVKGGNCSKGNYINLFFRNSRVAKYLLIHLMLQTECVSYGVLYQQRYLLLIRYKMSIQDKLRIAGEGNLFAVEQASAAGSLSDARDTFQAQTDFTQGSGSVLRSQEKCIMYIVFRTVCGFIVTDSCVWKLALL